MDRQQEKEMDQADHGLADTEMNESKPAQERKGADKPAGKGRKVAGWIASIAGIVLAVLTVALFLALVIPRHYGYDSYVVASGSMEPNLPVGCIVYVEKTDPEFLREGDIIAFVDETRFAEPITHRVVSNNPFTETIITKGDANEHEDKNPVKYDSIKGKVVKHVPCVGYPALLWPSGKEKIGAAVMLIAAWLLIEGGRRLRKAR